jgi:phosphoglycolate phosphatase-like HAD superfamily hydrolase
MPASSQTAGPPTTTFEATKPEPDLVRAALEKAGSDDAVMVGDTPWDVEAACRAGVETVCPITGGFSEQELREAGAQVVLDSVEQLRGHLDEVLRVTKNGALPLSL